MPDANTIQVNIVASTASYVAAMKDAASTTGSSAKAMQSEIAAIGSGASEARAPMGAFAGVIKEYRTEVRTEGRYSRFLAADIASMGLASKGAAGEVTMLISAFAFGGGMGIAIEGVKLLVKSINEASEAAEKQAEALKKIHEGVAESIKKSMEAVRKTFEEDNRTETEKAWAAEVDKGREQIKKLDDEIAKIRAHSGGLRDVFHALTTDAKGMNDAFTVEGTEDQIAKLQEQKNEIVKSLYAGKPLVTETAAAEAVATAKKAREQDLEDTAKWNASELAEYKKHYDQVTAATTKFLEDKFAAEDKEALDEAKLREDELKEYKKHYDAVTAETTRVLQEQFDAEERAAKKKVDAEIAEQKKLQRAAESAARGVGDAFGASFAGVVTGSQTMASAMKGILKSMLKAIIDMAIASITASAAKAEAEAIASQAGIPIIGPAIAVAAAAALGATVMGLIDTLPSAAVGADIPTFSNPIMQLHAGESVITHPTTDKLNEFLEGSSGGGDEIHVHIHGAIDGDSVRRVVNSDHFVRALRDARRTGRMP